jgi:hypothetical protein
MVVGLFVAPPDRMNRCERVLQRTTRLSSTFDGVPVFDSTIALVPVEPRSQRTRPRQRHRRRLNVWQHYQVSGDVDYLVDYGAA